MVKTETYNVYLVSNDS